MSKFRFALFGCSALSCAILSACIDSAGARRSFDPNLCNHGAAYEAGFNDGQDGRAMGLSFLDGCREDLRAQGQEGYRTGYDSGWKRFEQRMKEQQSLDHSREHMDEQPPAPPAGVVNTNNGIQINIGNGGPGGVPQANPRAWYCTIHAFTSDFEAYGPTHLEAQQLATQNCVRQYHPMHCQEVKCQQNQ